MKFTMKDKEILYAFGCPNLDATVDRLRAAAALVPDLEIKKLFWTVAIKLRADGTNNWYQSFFSQFCREMESYLSHKKILEKM